MIETEGLTHIHLLVSDLERSLRFYKNAFGLEPVAYLITYQEYP